MKKYLLSLLILILPFALNAQTSKNYVNRLGISLFGGINIPVSGNISSSVKTTDILNAGPQYAFAVSYFFTKSIGLELNSAFDLNFNKSGNKLNNKDFVVMTYSFSVNGIYNFGYLFKNPVVLPYIKGGIGVYKWKHYDDTPWDEGEIINTDGNQHKASCFGFNAAAGVDYPVSKHFSAGLLIDYRMYFPKDEEKFGNDFGGQGNLTPQFKLTYYLPKFK